ncbi:hypothetical protein Pmani_015273 [Petrolisthes manimaculis]|uniref:Ubiquitin-like domain-containing protein n=1 Tax=Petrolisthes manimaculis TaxID=1843537 RepID=A0AAE1PRY2_9EUCA|nr:hypothetical protein Pmani_015273 [Petrolisthes manimaculis]
MEGAMEIEKLDIYNAKSGKFVTSLYGLKTISSILEVKHSVNLQKSVLKPERQEVRLEQKGKGLKDEQTLGELGVKDKDGRLYVKDLGPQMGWSTVFVCEYAGPLFIYLWVFQRPWLLYGDDAALKPVSLCTQVAAGCWTVHYTKRLLETNALAMFVVCEVGNLSIHLALRNLRPPGTKERRVPYPNSNPLTMLFQTVSCPNYTYEVGAWVAFTVMTQCIPAGMFAVCGFYQMAMWAVGKHRNYIKDFKNYPKRKAIIPFIL